MLTYSEVKISRSKGTRDLSLVVTARRQTARSKPLNQVSHFNNVAAVIRLKRCIPHTSALLALGRSKSNLPRCGLRRGLAHSRRGRL